MASIYLRGEGKKKTYWGRFTRNGREWRRSLRTASRETARERLNAWLAELEGESFGEKAQHTFNEAAVKFVDEHLPTLKKKSATRYGVSISNLRRTFDGVDLRKIGTANLTEFKNLRTADGVRPATIRRDLNCLSSIIGMAIEWEWIEINPVGPFLRRMKRRGLKEADARTRYLNHGEEAALLANAAPYVAAAIKFAIDTGIRKEELFSRTWAHIDMARNEIALQGSTSKNAKDRRVPLLPRAREVLIALPRHDKVDALFWHNDLRRRRKPRRFLTMDRGLKAAAKRAGIKDLRWHDLRRTCGCRLLQDLGLSMEKVSKWLGHSSIAVTERAYAFLHVEHLHKAIEHAPALERPVIEGEAMEIEDDGRPRIS